MFRGAIIEESLRDSSILREVNVVKTRIERVTEEHGTPYLEKWTIHYVEVPDEMIDEISERLMRLLRDDDEWYIDFMNDEWHYIIFRDRIFKVRRGKRENYT